MDDPEPTITWSEEGVPFAPAFDDVYCSRSGVAQADLVFVEGSDLPARFARGEDVTIVETGLGRGLNLLAAVRAGTRARGGGALRHGRRRRRRPVGLPVVRLDQLAGI